MLRHKTKIEWLKLGDGNNSYFHASLKTKKMAKSMNMLYKNDGTVITNQDDLAHNVIDFYSSLMGTAADNISHVDIVAMRAGPQLSFEQRGGLMKPVSDKEVEEALKGIGDLKSPGIDGFGSKFFKASWHIVKHDVMEAIKDFFENGRMLKAVNCTVMTLIPKSENARTIRDYNW